MLRMIDDVEVCEDEDVLQQLEKSVNSSYSLLTSIKQHKHMTSTFSAAIPERNAPANKKIEVQKRFFFPTKRKTQRRNIRLAKPTKGEKMEMIENWKNNEQSEQNNSKVAVDFTSGKTMAHKVCCASLFEIFSSLPITPVSPHHLFISLVGLQEMLHWFTKEKHYSIEDLVKSAIKLSVSDVLDIDRASLITGEAIEANLADLKRFLYR